MSNKSDSAGKLHQYYTYLELKKSLCHITGSSPLDCPIKLNSHKKQFTSDELASLELIGKLSCAGFVDVTDDLVITSSEGFKYRYSLKCAKSMGAQSLLENYFTAPNLQIEFNQLYFKTLLVFLNSNLDEEEHYLMKKQEKESKINQML
jgi:hypothetical protein